MLLYKVTNLKNGKLYIGQTSKSLSIRKYFHENYAIRNSPLLFHCALRKYGTDNFSWETICNCSSKEEADHFEEFFILNFNSKVPNGYNLTSGGEGGTGYRHTEEAKRKIREASLGNKYGSGKQSEATCQKKRLAHLGEKNHNFGKKYWGINAKKSKEGVSLPTPM